MSAMLKGPYGQSTLEPSPYPYIIGRAPDSQLIVNDARASSHHAQLRHNGEGYEVVDLDSSNGTFVNEQRLVPHVPRLLSANDQIRIGDTTFVFEASNMPSQPTLEATVYGGGDQGSNLAYPPTVAAPPPAYAANGYAAQQSSNGVYTPAPYAPVAESYAAPQAASAPFPYAANGYSAQQSSNGAYAPPYAPNSYGVPQGGNGPYAPVQPRKSGRGKLWLIVGAIVGVLLIAAIAIGVIGYMGYVNRSTTTKTLNAYCTALKGGNYKVAYDQLSSGLQAKFGSEAAFAAGYSTNGGLGKITNCTVSNANDGANTGTISYVLSQGNAHSLVVDYGLINENNAVKINAQTPRSTPTLTLTNYCNALTQQDYQTAYNQLSADLQNQIGGESQFASSASAENIKGCTVKNADDAAGTGTLAYIRSDGNNTGATATLANEKGTWKINKLQSISSPTETLLTYCGALKSQDYQTAYDQLSSSAQSQETEAQFAANFSPTTVSDCKVSNVNDTAGTGSITYTLSNGNSGTLYYTLVNESGTWKINSEQQNP